MSYICIHFSRINTVFFKSDLKVCVAFFFFFCFVLFCCCCFCLFVFLFFFGGGCYCQYYSFSCFRSFALHPYHTNIN